MVASVAFASDAWVALLADTYGALPPVEGVDAVVEHTVTGGPEGDVAYWVELNAGRLTAAGVGPRPDATVTMTAPYGVAASVATGEVEASASFMQGRTKVAGDQAMLLCLLAVTATPEYRVATARLADRTTV
jgi:alkyl sulfatase BDS1-like metallo-beta-lactamase superfamily hydrolase